MQLSPRRASSILPPCPRPRRRRRALTTHREDPLYAAHSIIWPLLVSLPCATPTLTGPHTHPRPRPRTRIHIRTSGL